MSMKKKTPELELEEIIYDEGGRVKHEIPLRLQHARRGSLEKISKRYRQYVQNVKPGRAVYVILRWHPDYKVYEYLHTTTSKQRAITYLADTFDNIQARIGKHEFEKIYKIKKVICY